MHEEKEAYIPPPDARYETQDVLTPKVAKGFFLILTIGVIMSILAMGALLKWFVHTAEPARPTDPNVAAEGMPLPSGPRLQPAPGTDMQELAAKQQNRLEKYGKVDENHVHIPIERAMDLVLREGLPARQPVEAGGKQ